MKPQSCGRLNSYNFGFQSPKTKCHLDVGFIERRKVYYKGEGGGFPQVWAVMSLMNSKLLVARPNTKSAQTIH
jgi:hypothetical protein